MSYGVRYIQCSGDRNYTSFHKYTGAGGYEIMEPVAKIITLSMLKRATIDPPAKRYINGVSLVG